MKISDFIGVGFPSIISFTTVFSIAVLSVLFIENNAFFILDKLSVYAAIGGMPDITNPLWKWVDLTVGLILVAIVEEIIFRGYFFSFLRKYTQRPASIVFISAVAFGLIHWSGGLEQVFIATIAGAVFMLLYLRTHSLPPIMLAHFVINFIDFSNVIPTSLFQFFYAPPAG